MAKTPSQSISRTDTRSIVPTRRSEKPKLAITVGDVAGVGPELAIRCAGLDDLSRRCQLILYGPGEIVSMIAGATAQRVGCPIRSVGEIDASEVRAGVFTRATGLASYQAVERALSDCVDGVVDAIVTGPIQKEAWHAAGVGYPGHTEMLADRLGVDDFCMMLTSPQISCVLATVHLPLADVPASLTVESVVRAIRLGAAAMRRRHRREARVTVCGLNPHAGENGLLSRGEESATIGPAIEIARRDGITVCGPLSPDTAFTPATRRDTDVYVCMYHDQGLIPLKALAFDDAVNVTLGLPIVRTSVDHGTAMDLAWQGKASEASMRAAIELAIDLAGDGDDG